LGVALAESIVTRNSVHVATEYEHASKECSRTQQKCDTLLQIAHHELHTCSGEVKPLEEDLALVISMTELKLIFYFWLIGRTRSASQKTELEEEREIRWKPQNA